MTTYSALYIDGGRIRRIWFEADDESKAAAFCERSGIGFQGPCAAPQQAVPAEAYDEKTARQMLGGISLSTLTRWIDAGKLARVPGTRRVLITRQSLEQLLAARSS